MNLFRELKRRNVFRVGLAYLVAAWLVAQVTQLAAESFSAPEWIMKMLIVLLIVAFPAVIFFSWAYELTPEGLKRESEVAKTDSITHHTAKRLDYVTIVLVLLASALVVWDRMSPSTMEVVSVPQQAESVPAIEPKPQAVDRSIAVLPFVNLSDDPENEYFADGLSEELLNRLAQLPELRVAGRTSSFEFKGQNRDLRVIAEKLGVANILEGSVRRSGETVRITAQLIRASDGFHTWSNTYDRTLEDIFQVQDEIAERVAGNLDVLMDEDRRETMRRVGVRNVEAFIAYQKGWEAFSQGHNTPNIAKGLEPANEFFRQATDLYPDFHNAWYWQSDLYQHILSNPESSIEQLELAARENDRVLSAAFEHAQTPQQKAFTNVTRKILSNNWSNLSEMTERALEMQTCAGVNWSELLFPFGVVEDPAREANIYRKCVGKFTAAIGFVRMQEGYLLTGRKDEALALADQAIEELGQSANTSAIRVRSLLALKRYGDAVTEAAQIDQSNARLGYLRAVTLAAAGRREEALREAEAWMQGEGSDIRSRLELYNFLGQREKANALAAQFDQRPGYAIILAGENLGCMCGALWDLDATPNFKARLEEAELDWPPAAPVRIPVPGEQ